MRFSEAQRSSESPLIERIWRSESDQQFGFISRAENHSEIVIARHEGKTTVTVRGPETFATRATVAANTDCIGIVFKLGAYIPLLLPGDIMDRRDADLPLVGKRRFIVGNDTWEIPTYENVDTFVARLVRQQILVHDSEVASIVQDQPTRLSKRAAQYRVLRSTGLPLGTIRQIRRAQRAAALLSQGASIADTVFETGYFDQSHLTRSLKRFSGCTPLQIAQAQ